MTNQFIEIYDTTLRDGTQSEEISFTVEDKIRIAEKLDESGIHYIEAGWPGSNPKDEQFFSRIKKEKLRLQQAKIVAFGSTCRKGIKPSADRNVKGLLNSGVSVITIFGKSWDLHVREALHISLAHNLDLIFESVKYLKGRVGEVIYDAEHFFDGYKAEPEYALKTLEAASQAGADRIVLCDTNGGTLPMELGQTISEVGERIATPLGIHAHNDSDVAVANSLVAVQLGVVQIHGTINGFGERCGNTNLVSVIPNLKLKLGIDCVSSKQLKGLRSLSRFVDELANRIPERNQPYVGDSAFAHKGGVHVSAVVKNSSTYEHIDPGLVGNRQRVLVSDLSGQSNVIYKAKEFGIHLKPGNESTKTIVKELKRLENQGYQFEGAEASFEILMRHSLKNYRPSFKLIGFQAIDQMGEGENSAFSEATIQIEVGGEREHTASAGRGPVNALDNALRKALERFYPQIREVELVDYKVRVLPAGKGTASQVRVLIESRDKKDKWGTVGVSENIIQASWEALVHSLEYKLMKDKR